MLRTPFPSGLQNPGHEYCSTLHEGSWLSDPWSSRKFEHAGSQYQYRPRGHRVVLYSRKILVRYMCFMWETRNRLSQRGMVARFEGAGTGRDTGDEADARPGDVVWLNAGTVHWVQGKVPLFPLEIILFLQSYFKFFVLLGFEFYFSKIIFKKLLVGATMWHGTWDRLTSTSINKESSGTSSIRSHTFNPLSPCCTWPFKLGGISVEREKQSNLAIDSVCERACNGRYGPYRLETRKMSSETQNRYLNTKKSWEI